MLGILDRVIIRFNDKNPKNNDQDFYIKKYFLKRNSKLFWVCFLPKRVSWQTAKRCNLIPRKGNVLMYRVPNAFLSSSPVVVKKAFDILKNDFEKEYKQRKLFRKKVSFSGLSVGTMPAFYFANKFPCEKLIAVCPVDKLGCGIFDSLAAEKMKIRSMVLKRGYDSDRYDRIINDINPVNNIDNLPKKITVYLARFDKFTSFYRGLKLIRNIEQHNKKVSVKKFNFIGHFVTMCLFGLTNRE